MAYKIDGSSQKSAASPTSLRAANQNMSASQVAALRAKGQAAATKPQTKPNWLQAVAALFANANRGSGQTYGFLSNPAHINQPNWLSNPAQISQTYGPPLPQRFPSPQFAHRLTPGTPPPTNTVLPDTYLGQDTSWANSTSKYANHSTPTLLPDTQAGQAQRNADIAMGGQGGYAGWDAGGGTGGGGGGGAGGGGGGYGNGYYGGIPTADLARWLYGLITWRGM